MTPGGNDRLQRRIEIGNVSRTRTGSRFAYGSQTSVCVYIYIYDYLTKLCRQQAEVIKNHENANVRNVGQGEPRHREYKRLKLGGGQAYDRSSD
jgi:hypothetical protein